MNFGYVVYNTANYQKALIKEGREAKNDFKLSLREAGRLMERVLRLTSPDSRKSGRSWPLRAAENRAKWGVLKRSVGMYDTKTSRLKEGETVGVNVGFLKSKGDKYFIARFMDYGAYNNQTERVENYYKGYIKVLEEMTLPLMKETFEKNVNIRVSNRLNAFGKRWTKF